jgi:hypothetical protein
MYTLVSIATVQTLPRHIFNTQLYGTGPGKTTGRQAEQKGKQRAVTFDNSTNQDDKLYFQIQCIF